MAIIGVAIWYLYLIADGALIAAGVVGTLIVWATPPRYRPIAIAPVEAAE